MKFLVTQLLILILSVAALLYFSSLEYFLPFRASGGLNWYSISTVLFLAFFFLQSIISLLIFLTQKFIAYGIKEFPDYRGALRWGLVLSSGFVLILFLNALHILSLEWGIGILLLVIFIVTII